jgi:hypothetical protein
MITWGLNMGTFGKHGKAFLWTIAHKGVLTTIVIDDHFRLGRECRYLLTYDTFDDLCTLIQDEDLVQRVSF